jgi:hypothetical protein
MEQLLNEVHDADAAPRPYDLPRAATLPVPELPAAQGSGFYLPPASSVPLPHDLLPERPWHSAEQQLLASLPLHAQPLRQQSMPQPTAARLSAQAASKPAPGSRRAAPVKKPSKPRAPREKKAAAAAAIGAAPMTAPLHPSVPAERLRVPPAAGMPMGPPPPVVMSEEVSPPLATPPAQQHAASSPFAAPTRTAAAAAAALPHIELSPAAALVAVQAAARPGDAELLRWLLAGGAAPRLDSAPLPAG